MTRYADPLRCPDCGAEIEYGAPACTSCDLPLLGELPRRLFQTLSQADELLAAMRASRVTAAPAGTAAEQPIAVGRFETPTVAAPAARGLSAASVPKILLGLGAACVLVAALVFLAVTWSVMGVGGRTATLVGFTVASGALAWWMARRDLRGAGEALSLVALGLLTLDVFGARDAGWLGDVSDAVFLVALGGILAAAGAAAALAVRRTAVGELTGAGIVSGLGVALAAWGVGDSEQLPGSADLVLAVVLAGLATLVAHRLGLLVTAGVAGGVAALAWLVQLAHSTDRAVSHSTLEGLWVELHGWPLLASAALAGSVAALRSLPVPARVGAASASYGVLTLAALVPALDETATPATVAILVALGAAGALGWLAPRPWGMTAAIAQAGCSLWALITVASLGGVALNRLAEAGAAGWTGSPTGRLTGQLPSALPDPWTLPLSLAALGLTGVVVARLAHDEKPVVGRDTVVRVAAALVAASGVATLALYEVPVWVAVAATLAAGVGFVAWWLRDQRVLTLALAAAFVLGGVGVSWYAEELTAPALLVALALASTVHLRASSTDTGAVAGAVLAAVVAGSVWTWGAVLEADGAWTALAGLALLALVALTVHLAAPGWWSCTNPVMARAGVEAGAAASALPLGMAGVLYADPDTAATWTAVYLTLAGATVTASSLLRPDRRMLRWPGVALLVLASWVRLWDVGVREPEPYTLPTAALLLAVGLLHLREHPSTSTATALGPGLGLALVPSLLWALAEPAHIRSVLLGLACLGLVVGGVRLRWTAPVTFGAAVGGILVARLAAPYVGDAVPRWLLIGTAGAVLITLGVTWERRLQEARQMMAYVRGLR